VTGLFLFVCDEEMGIKINPLNAKLNPICHLLALLEAHTILHVRSVRVKNVINPYPANVENMVSS
jgi:hypothetical protein